MDLVFWVVVGGIVGARVFYIFLNKEFFLEHPTEIIMLHHGGLAFQGSLIAGLITGLVFIRRRGLPLGRTLDLVSPYIALGHAIGRIGCFLNGCCYGKPWIYGIYFPVHEERLHPTQLYESLGLLLLFLFLKNLQSRNQVPGRVFIWYLLLASALRFGVEFFRADHLELFWGLSIFQMVSLGVFAAGLYAKYHLESHSRK